MPGGPRNERFNSAKVGLTNDELMEALYTLRNMTKRVIYILLYQGSTSFGDQFLDFCQRDTRLRDSLRPLAQKEVMHGESGSSRIYLNGAG
jgi:hypothetical protein